MDTNVLGIVSKSRRTGRGTYYYEALNFYDDVIFIDPLEVNYSIKKGDVPNIEYQGHCLNNLSMLYLFSHKTESQQQLILLIRTLLLSGCPISDNFENYLRDNIGKAYETLKKIGTEGDIPSYIVSSYGSAKRFFTDLAPDKFPLVSKPIFGNKGRGIRKFETKEQILKFLSTHFSRSNNLITFEEYIDFLHEWRVYIVDGEILCTYERCGSAESIASNLHMGGSIKETAPQHIAMVCSFVRDNLVEEYNQGIYGVDVGLSIQGQMYIIETNRRPGWKGVSMVSEINFPYEVNKILFKRARKYD